MNLVIQLWQIKYMINLKEDEKTYLVESINENNSIVTWFEMDFLIEFWRFLRIRKKYWLLPTIIVLIIFGGLIILTQGTAVAPFIYTIF